MSEFYETPEKLTAIDAVGDLHVQWFIDNYTAKRAELIIPIFEKVYEFLLEGKRFSHTTGLSMHADRKIWILKHPEAKIIVLETQSQRYIYIQDGRWFHIRQLYYRWGASHLKGIHPKSFKTYSSDYKVPHLDRHPSWRYLDGRDYGYVLSLQKGLVGIIPSRCQHVNLQQALYPLTAIEDWGYYLTNEEE